MFFASLPTYLKLSFLSVITRWKRRAHSHQRTTPSSHHRSRHPSVRRPPTPPAPAPPHPAPPRPIPTRATRATPRPIPLAASRNSCYISASRCISLHLTTTRYPRYPSTSRTSRTTSRHLPDLIGTHSGTHSEGGGVGGVDGGGGVEGGGGGARHGQRRR